MIQLSELTLLVYSQGSVSQGNYTQYNAKQLRGIIIWPSLVFPNAKQISKRHFPRHITGAGERRGGEQPRDTGDGRGLESGRGAPPARGGCSSVPPGPGTGGHANDWSRPAPH